LRREAVPLRRLEQEFRFAPRSRFVDHCKPADEGAHMQSSIPSSVNA
jgi:hypothetical protein